jgi:hypothetical protein
MRFLGKSAAPAAPAHTNPMAAKRTIELTAIFLIAFLLS